jgi:signal transduction histidine kinase
LVTKLKNFPRSIFLKTLILVMMLLSVPLKLWGAYEIERMENAYSVDSFYETSQFKSNFIRLAHNIVERDIVLTDENSIFALETSQQSKLDKVARLRQINANLEEAKSLDYLLVSKQTGRIFSNLPENQQQSIFDRRVIARWDYAGVYYPEESVFRLDSQKQYYNNDVFRQWGLTEELQRLLSLSDHELYVALKAEFVVGDTFFTEPFAEFTRFKENQDTYLGAIILGAFIILLGLIYLTIFAGDGTSRKIAYDHVPFEIQGIITVLSSIPMAVYMQSMPRVEDFSFILIFAGTLNITLLALFFCYQSTVRRLKRGAFIKELLVSQLLLKLINGLTFDSRKGVFKPWVVLLFIGYAGINMCFVILMLLGMRNMMILFFFPAFIVFNLTAISMLIPRLRSINKVMAATHERARGRLDYSLEINDLTPEFQGCGRDLNTLQDGMQKALTEALKGERLKTELITNVTHDLKNPLTSIISYVDLIKLEEVDNEKVMGYVEVLDEKAQRLKSLIEQLVEASKASSGNIEVIMEELDVCQLIQQILGEYEEKFESQGLQLIVSEMQEPFHIQGDGRLLHRIMDNLMMNIFKYALENTRVYIDFNHNTQSLKRIEIKNISKEPLNMSPELLSERFVRGDSSRHTEGSGLGLSIASHLALAMGAQLNIHIDGDLFKAELIFS